MSSSLRPRAHDSFSTLLHRPKAESVIFRRTINLEEGGGGGGNMQGSILTFSWSLPSCLFTVSIWSASSHAANRASINIPSLGLSRHNKSLMPHLFCVVKLLSFHCRHNDRREKISTVWRYLPFFGCSITSLCCCSWCSSVSSFIKSWPTVLLSASLDEDGKLQSIIHYIQ